MIRFRAAVSLAVALAAIAILPACSPSESKQAAAPAPALAPAPAPAPDPQVLAGDACESAVLANFRKAKGHAQHELTLAPEQRKVTAGKSDILNVAGGGSYPGAKGKAVKVTYTCYYNARTAKVVASRFK
jgi:hypothetical protein